MTYPKAFPDAEWVGSKRDGKPWIGTTAPMVVLHTLEFEAWPDPDRWDSPSHLVYNPWTREIYQYLPMDKAAYAVRDNALEDDAHTWQVELWGRAASVPGYSDEWYAGVAELCDTFIAEYDIPMVFADFSRVAVAYPGSTPDRMTDAEANEFTGFLGHCHMGLGVDTHWDPGRLDTDKVLSYMQPKGDNVTYEEFVRGIVTGWDEDQTKTKQEFDRLYDEGKLGGQSKDTTVGYWMQLLADPSNREWLGFYARTLLSTW